MPVKFFGQYLVDQGLLRARQLKDVDDHTYFVHRTVGELAAKRGLLTAAQCAKVLERQAETDRFFGEICVDEGLLTQSQLDDILEQQRTRHVRVGEVLLELGHLDEATLKAALERYRADQAPYDAARRAPAPALAGTPAERVLDLFPRLALRAGGVHVRLGDFAPWKGQLTPQRALCVELDPEQQLWLGLGCENRFGAALLQVARGSVEPEVPESRLRRGLEVFGARLARQLAPTARSPQWGALPAGGTVCDFISTRGNGFLVFGPPPAAG